MDLKHRTSISDIVDDIDNGKLPSREKLAEKMNDSINYLLLLEALIVERLDGAEAKVHFDDDLAAKIQQKGVEVLQEGSVGFERPSRPHSEAFLRDRGREIDLDSVDKRREAELAEARKRPGDECHCYD